MPLFCSQLLIFREQDAALMSSVRELTLASCGFVSLPSSGLSGSTALVRVTVRDMKLFHYTAGLFPALESLSVEDVGELVLDGFGQANRTLRHLTLQRTNVIRLVKGTVTAGAPLRRVLFDRVDIDEIESGALDMVFVGDYDNAQAAVADGFTIVDSTVITYIIYLENDIFLDCLGGIDEKIGQKLSVTNIENIEADELYRHELDLGICL